MGVVDAGSSQGLVPGLELHGIGESSRWIEIRITKVEERQAEIDLKWRSWNEATSGPPAIGCRLSTRDPICDRAETELERSGAPISGPLP